MKPCICSNRGHRASILARSAETSPRDRPQGTLTRPSHDRLCLTSHGHVTCFVLQLQIAMPEGAGGFSPLRMGRKIRAFRPGFEQFSTSATVGSEAVEDKPASTAFCCRDGEAGRAQSPKGFSGAPASDSPDLERSESEERASASALSSVGDLATNSIAGAGGSHRSLSECSNSASVLGLVADSIFGARGSHRSLGKGGASAPVPASPAGFATNSIFGAGGSHRAVREDGSFDKLGDPAADLASKSIFGAGGSECSSSEGLGFATVTGCTADAAANPISGATDSGSASALTIVKSDKLKPDSSSGAEGSGSSFGGRNDKVG